MIGHVMKQVFSKVIKIKVCDFSRKLVPKKGLHAKVYFLTLFVSKWVQITGKLSTLNT
jgi:hypothetical protein